MDSAGSLTHWRLWLSTFELDSVYQEALKHRVIQALSCLQTAGADNKKSNMICSYLQTMQKTDDVAYLSAVQKST